MHRKQICPLLLFLAKLLQQFILRLWISIKNSHSSLHVLRIRHQETAWTCKTDLSTTLRSKWISSLAWYFTDPLSFVGISKEDLPIWVFPKIVVKPPKWVVYFMENLIKMGWFGDTPIFGNTHLLLSLAFYKVAPLSWNQSVPISKLPFLYCLYIADTGGVFPLKLLRGRDVTRR